MADESDWQILSPQDFARKLADEGFLHPVDAEMNTVIFHTEWEAVYPKSEYEIRLTMRMIDQTPHCIGVSFHSTRADRGVPAKAVREFRLEDYIEDASTSIARTWDEDRQEWVTGGYYYGRSLNPTLSAIRKARAKAHRGYPDELLQEVARIYESDQTGRPTKAVHEQLVVGKSTAQLYVKKAREAGFITSPAPKGIIRKAGEPQ